MGAIGADCRRYRLAHAPGTAAADGASSGVACPVTRRARSPSEADHEVERLGDARPASRRPWTDETTRALNALGHDLHIIEPLPGPKRAEFLGVGAHAGGPAPDIPRGGHALEPSPCFDAAYRLPRAKEERSRRRARRLLIVSMKEGGLSRSRGQTPLTLLADCPGERRRVRRLGMLTGVSVGWLMALDAAA
jgi:hypothetical protein